MDAGHRMRSLNSPRTTASRSISVMGISLQPSCAAGVRRGALLPWRAERVNLGDEVPCNWGGHHQLPDGPEMAISLLSLRAAAHRCGDGGGKDGTAPEACLLAERGRYIGPQC